MLVHVWQTRVRETPRGWRSHRLCFLALPVNDEAAEVRPNARQVHGRQRAHRAAHHKHILLRHLARASASACACAPSPSSAPSPGQLLEHILRVGQVLCERDTQVGVRAWTVSGRRWWAAMGDGRRATGGGGWQWAVGGGVLLAVRRELTIATILHEHRPGRRREQCFLENIRPERYPKVRAHRQLEP